MTLMRTLTAGSAALMLSTGAVAAGWIFTDLGVGSAFAIDEAGQIVGANGNAVEYVDGGQVLLPFLPGSHFSAALAINAAGTSVGYTDIQQPNDTDLSTATVFTSTTARAIATLAGFLNQQANDINDSGVAVGTATADPQQPGTTMAFVVANGVISPLGSLNGGNYSTASSINAAGDIVGSTGHVDALGNCPDCIAFLIHGGVMSPVALPPGASTSFGQRIGDSGEIIGNAILTATGLATAFSASNGKATPIPNLPGANTNTATSLNGKGAIVGVSSVQSGGVTTDASAYLYANGRLTNLSRLSAVTKAGFTSLVPQQINDAGQIVGMAKPRRSLEPHAFLLTPSARAAADEAPSKSPL